jgi:hypothetical protein
MRARYRILMVACVLASVPGCGKRSSVTLDVSAEAQAQAQSAKAEAGPAFAFTKDEGGKMLSSMLPSDAVSTARPQAQSGPRRLTAPATLETPDIRLPLQTASPALPAISPKEDPKKKPKPRMLPTDPPLSRQAYDITPRRDDLPTSPLTRVTGVDVEQIQVVPTLSQGLPDRVSLDDPTAAFSLGLVLVTSAPERASPAPPWFLNLPDPFEHHRVVKIQALPPEDTLPPR